MLKRLQFLILICCLFATTSINAQLADGSFAPDWTLTDLDGNTHHLYDYLDQGYTVVIDFSATWCGPCWSYHNSGALENLYIDHGPAGMPNVSANTTDDVMVFFIEGDASTGMQDLMGTTSASQGDWITNTPYPIIDDASMTQPYSIGFWPTIYTVCPNRQITLSGQISTSNHYSFAQTCPKSSAGTDGFAIDIQSTDIICDGDAQMDLLFQNLGTDEITSATLNVLVDGQVGSTVNWTGNLSTYDYDVASLGMVSGLTASSNVTVEVAVSGDNNAANNSRTASLEVPTEEAFGIEVTVEIKTDQYGSETSWELIDFAGTLLGSGSGFGNNQTYTTTHNLPAGSCYMFAIYDAYGDGGGTHTLTDETGAVVAMTSGNFGDDSKTAFETCTFGLTLASTPATVGNSDGSATITSASGVPGYTILWDASAGNQTTATATGLAAGTYGVIVRDVTGCASEAFVVVTETVVGTNDIDGLSGMNVYPNPVADLLNVDFSLSATKSVQVSIFNSLGQVVSTQDATSLSAGENTVSINTSEFANGVYLLRLQTAEGQVARSFTVTK